MARESSGCGEVQREPDPVSGNGVPGFAKGRRSTLSWSSQRAGASDKHAGGLTATVREKLHRLLDDLPERDLPAAEEFLENLWSAAWTPSLPAQLANAPVDSEEETTEEMAVAAEGRAAVLRGETVSWNDVKRRLDLAE